MTYAASSLSFVLGQIKKMEELPPDFGIEIFYEWGSESYWDTFLSRAMRGRSGGFSIHSPFGYCDFATTETDETLFALMSEPFRLYHKYGGTHYVVHTNGAVGDTLSEDARDALRQTVARRLASFERLCTQQGVTLVVENVLGNDPPLFNEQQYLRLFADNPSLYAILDTGHAHVAGFDIENIQKTLGKRLLAYHIHDNAGQEDTHSHILTGLAGGIDWRAFQNGVVRFTPDATLTFEYGEGFADVFVRDRDRLAALG